MKTTVMLAVPAALLLLLAAVLLLMGLDPSGTDEVARRMAFR